MSLARGEIWWHEPPDEKPRPVLVLTRSEAIARLDKLIAVPATRTVRGLSTEVELGREDGMLDPCALSADNVTVVRKSLLTRRIATLGPAKLVDVCRALNAAVSC